MCARVEESYCDCCVQRHSSSFIQQCQLHRGRWQCHLGTITKSITAPVLFSKNIEMSLLAGLNSGSRWANVLLRWIPKAFQCSNMFWLCILIRPCPSYNITDRTSSCPLWACWSHSAQLRGHRLQKHRVSESCPDNALCHRLFWLAFLPSKYCRQVWGRTSLSERL